MFEYAKKDLEEKLKCLSEKYEEQDLECQKYEADKNKFHNYFDIVSNLIRSIMVLIVLVPCFVLSTVNVVHVFLPIFLGTLTGLDIYAITGIRKLLKKHYSEFLHKKNLTSMGEEIEIRALIAANKKQEIEEKIAKCSRRLDEVNRMQEESKVVLPKLQDPYYLAFNEREYQKLCNQGKNGVNDLFVAHLYNLFDNYLEEGISPDKVHFGNHIGSEIEYTAKSKKLLKKM